MAKLRVRFAPNLDPVHIGTARVAIMNYLYAKHSGGECIVRIDDVDRDLSAADGVEEILDDLRWLKLEWDEGPLCGGNFGPYRQSLRSKIYKEHINILVDKGLLYPCYCQKDYSAELSGDISELHETKQYDNRCRNLTEVEKLSFENQGIKPVWRFKVQQQEIVVTDLIQGEMVFDASKMGDFVVIKSDGAPVSHFAGTIDDYLMEISHIIKCDDSFFSTAINMLIFKAFDYPVPEFAHLGVLNNVDGKPFLKSEHARLSIHNLREKGYLPEAIVNYLVNLSIPVKVEKKYFLLKELVQQFNLKKITGSDMVFDKNELDAYGNHYIQDADITRLTDLAMPYLKENNLLTGNLDENEYQYLIDVVKVIRHNVSSLSEIPGYAEVFLKELVNIPDVVMNELQKSEAQSVLAAAMELIDQVDVFTENEAVESLIEKIVQETSLDSKKVCKVMKWVLTGSENGLELTEILRLLTKEKVKLRIGNVLS